MSQDHHALDEQLRKHYAAQNLSPQRVDHILAQARAPRARKRTTWLYAAASLSAAALLAVVLLTIGSQGGDKALVQAIVAEVAANHLKHKDVEIRSDRYEEVQAGLDRLDFSVLPARASLLRDYAVVGGRYCSIQENLAAQLQLQHRQTDEVVTLYVTRIEGLHPAAGRSSVNQNVRVEMWSDDDRLFALARAVDE